MLCTVEESKTILRRDDYDDDNTHEVLLRYAQADLVEYLDNYFVDSLITYRSGSLSFVPGEPDTIIDADDQFVAKGFTSGDVVIEWAHANTGIHEVASVSASTLTLSSDNELVAMSYNDADHPIRQVKISRVNWPKALKLVCAKMAWFLYTKEGARPDDMRAKTMDGTVIEYAGNNPYPLRILSAANKWKRPRFV